MLRLDICNHTLIIAVFSTLLGCNTAQEMGRGTYKAPSTQQVLSPDVTIKNLIDENKLAIDYEASSKTQGALAEAKVFLEAVQKNKDYKQAVEKTCETFPAGAFCKTQEKSEYFPRVVTENLRLSNSERQEILKNISASKFEALTQSPEFLISAISRLSKSAISNSVQAILKSEACYSNSLYFAAGYAAESLLPGAEQKSYVTDLYYKSVNCGNDEVSARSAFRLALFMVDENKCKEALPLFERVLTHDSLKTLHSRSKYWVMKCKANGSENRTAAVEAYLDSALSFHALLGLQDVGVGLYERIEKNTEPLAISRSSENKVINQTLRVVEYLIVSNERRGARNLLLSLQFDELYNENPVLAIYVSYLFHRIDEGLFTFQTLSRVLSRNPELKTPATMKLYYPNWYFDIVQKHAKAANLDPYLVMALIRQESAFQSNARSGAKAMGLMQLLPSTARMVDRRVSTKQLFDPEINVRLGTQYLARGLKRFDDNIHVTLAAYNAGGGIVGTWLKRYPMQDVLVFADIIPYRETREYVGSIMRNYYWYKALYEKVDVALRPPGASKQAHDLQPDTMPDIPEIIDVLPPANIEEEVFEQNFFRDEMLP